MNKKIIIGISIVVIASLFFVRNINKNIQLPEKGPNQSTSQNESEISAYSVIAENLDTPWGIAFLPDGSMLVTERVGNVRLIDKEKNLQTEPVLTSSSVKEIGEGGLLGITIHPDYATNKYVYLYYTYEEERGNTLNRVVRMTYDKGQLTNEEIIVDKIPGASNHNGGRIKFGPDGYLYITTGDAQEPTTAQDTNALSGKILRVNDDGESVVDNPFNNQVFSYGHRNPQGLAWDSGGQLWATEHGPSGISSGFDEVNLIEKGKNYGWPQLKGDEKSEEMEPPALHSGSTSTWAPAGVAYVDDSLFFGGLRGAALYQVEFIDTKMVPKEHFKAQFGRIRDVILGPDNFLYITTSNRDGRGSPSESDDRIIRVNLEAIK